MTPIPARLMRAQVQACPTRPRPTERDRQRRAYILDAATGIFTAHGRLRVTLREIAIATGISQTGIRRHFADLDHLFALVLARHLDTILAAIGAVPHHHPDLKARRRAEYLRVTRGFCNVPTPMHFLWLRERFTLPDDELQPLEQRLGCIGTMLAGEAWQTALLLLDSAHLDEAQIETMLAAHARTAEVAAQSPKIETPTVASAPPDQSAAARLVSATDTAARHTPPMPSHAFHAATPRIGRPPPRGSPARAA